MSRRGQATFASHNWKFVLLVLLALLVENISCLLSGNRENVRLPTALKPFHYKLSLIPDLDPANNFTINGTALIDLLCNEATDRVVLNIKDIQINEGTVSFEELGGQAEGFQVVGHGYDTTSDQYGVTLNGSLSPGSSYRLQLEYQALLSDQLVGFYRSSYTDEATNETRWIGVSQFSPTDARRAFPSFDEPAFKAKYEISLGRKESMNSISCMNLLRTEPIEGKEGWVLDHYAETLPMSSYLVGFAVTDFLPNPSNVSVPKFQVWSRKDALSQTDYARDIGPRILAYFEEYFGIPFPLPKLDMIGVSDHKFNAMENWGLITYRELVLLFDPAESSDADKQGIAQVVSHELGHQWFGNLVTPSWWSDLWLKEGFASYLEYLGTDHVESEWKILDRFVLQELQTVFRMDTLNSSHPISVPVDNPNQINEIFDAISYAKGCTIIRMMDHFLSQATFKQGLTNYLNKWKYNNTAQADLWESLTEQAHADGTLPPSITVGQIMDTWTLQKGFPVINVERDYQGQTVNFTQAKFQFLLGNGEDVDFSNYTWHVPLSYASNSFNADFSSTAPQLWMEPNQSGLEKELSLGADDWLIVNVQTTAYYRVNYDLENWERLRKQLAQTPGAVHLVNQAQLLDDSLSLARASLLPYGVPLNMSLYLKTQTQYLPWESFLQNLDHLYNMFLGKESLQLLKNYVESLLQDEYVRLGFVESDTESMQDKAHRIHILSWACKIGLSDCVQRSTQMFKDWMEGVDRGIRAPNAIPINLRGVVYCTAIGNGGEAEWNFARDQYLRVNVASEKNRMLTAMACSTNKTTLNQYLNDAVSPGSGIRKQDSRNVLERVGATEVGNALTFKFLQDEFPRIQQYFGAGLSIDRIIDDAVAVKLNTAQDLVQLEQFRSAHEGEFGFGARAVDEAIEIVKTNLYWMEHNYEAVVGWLSTNFSSTA